MRVPMSYIPAVEQRGPEQVVDARPAMGSKFMIAVGE
jgi:hypothetical protein